MHCQTVVFLLTALWASDSFAEPSKPVVTVQKAVKSDLSDEVTYPARVASQVNANILADIDGVVVKILKPIGSTVNSGSAIVSIKNTDPVYEYVPVQVKSAVGGIISAQDISVGSMVHRGQVISVVTDPSKLILKLEVTSNDMRHIKRGFAGEFTQSNLSKAVTFEVAGVSPMIDPATGTATVEMTSRDPAAKQLSVGSIGKVNFKINGRPGIILPEQALVYRGKDVFVRTVTDSKVTFKKVTLGASKRGTVEVLTGLTDGEQFVTQTTMFVADGQEVTVQAPVSDVATSK